MATIAFNYTIGSGESLYQLPPVTFEPTCGENFTDLTIEELSLVPNLSHPVSSLLELISEGLQISSASIVLMVEADDPMLAN